MRTLPDGALSLTSLGPQAARVAASRIANRAGSTGRASGLIAPDFDADFLAELVHGERIHHAAVVPRDDKEVVKSDPVLVAIRAFERQQLRGVVVR